MINYTERLTLLDAGRRVPRAGAVVHRHGRRAGVCAGRSIECGRRVRDLPLPDAAGRANRATTSGAIDRRSALTRRSEWFVTKSPVVTVGSRDIKYMISFALPRFCDQSLDRSRKEQFYPGADPWIAKLDTVVHELYHIDPELAGIRRIEKEDGTYSANCHGQQFFEQVAEHGPHLPGQQPVAGRSTTSCATTSRRSTRATAASSAPASGRSRRSRSATSSGSRSSRRASRMRRGVKVEPLRAPQQPTRYTEDDLHVREFMAEHVAPADSQGPVQGGVESLSSAIRRAPRIPRRPVARAEMLDAHDAGRARRVHELIAADRDRHVRRSRIGRREEQRCRRARDPPALTDFPTRYCSRTSRGSDRPYCEKTYCVNPLQSKPLGSAPPLR